MSRIAHQAPASMFPAANENHLCGPDACATQPWGGHDDMDRHITLPHLSATPGGPRAGSGMEPGKVRLALDILRQLQPRN